METTRTLIAILLAALLLAPAVSAIDAPQSVRAQWWGPDGMTEGWHIRAPVAVANTGALSVTNATAGYDLDLGALLTSAGWPARATGADQPASFTLDPRSVRVVEYRALATGGPLDGVIVGPVASRPILGDLSTKRAYDPSSHPSLHVDWAMPGELRSNTSRYFEIYVDSISNGPKADTEPDPGQAALDARYWIGRGTTLYGKAGTVVLTGLQDGTVAEVMTYASGKPRPVANGRVTLDKGQETSVRISDEVGTVQVTSNFPVLAAGTEGQADGSGVSGPIPSADGGVLGTRFTLPSQTPEYLVYLPSGSASAKLDEGPSHPLAGSTPFWPVLSNGVAHTLESTRPVLVLAWPGTRSAPFVAPEGTPLGTSLIGMPYNVDGLSARGLAPPTTLCQIAPVGVRSGGTATIYAAQRPAYYRGLDAISGEPRYPLSQGDVSPRPGPIGDAPASFQAAPPANRCPMTIASTGPVDGTVGAAKLGAFGGSGKLAGAMGLVNATDGTVYGPATVVAPYNGTLLTMTSSEGPKTKGLDAADALDVAASLGSPVALHASKPILVLMEGAGTFFAGIDGSLKAARVGPAEFRGYLLDLRPADGSADPVIGVGAPGHPASYRFVVRNLARDAHGDAVADQARLSTDPVPPGWTASFAETSLALAPNGERAITLTVTPPADAPEGSRLTLGVHATSVGQPAMQVSATTVTVLRVVYGVDSWFDREGGPKQSAFVLDGGATKDVDVVVKNLASVKDRVLVSATSLSPGWGISISGAPGALNEIELGPGGSAKVTLRIHAPEGASSQSLLQVGATSVSDAKASSQLSAVLRTRADRQIRLGVGESTVEASPGSNATFAFTLHNGGNDDLGAKWTVEAHLPPDWAAPVTQIDGQTLTTLAGIPPQSDLAIALVVPIPANATRGELETLGLSLQTVPQYAGDPVLSESESVHVLVAARHLLVPAGGDRTLRVDANGTARATLRVQNLGNGPEDVTISPAVLPPNTSIVTTTPPTIPQGGQRVLDATLSISPRMPAGSYPVSLSIVSDDGHANAWNFTLEVPEIRGVRLVAESPTTSTVGATASATFLIENTGNVPLGLPPALLLPLSWTPDWGAKTGKLEPGASLRSTLALTTTRNATSGRIDLAPDPVWATGPAVPWTLRAVALHVNATATSKAVAAVVANAGDGDALDLDVSLYRNGALIDRIVLPRVPAGRSTNATLGLPPGGGALEVRVDEASRFGDPVVTSLGVQEKDAPGPGAWSALVALAGLAALGARRRARSERR